MADFQPFGSKVLLGPNFDLDDRLGVGPALGDTAFAAEKFGLVTDDMFDVAGTFEFGSDDKFGAVVPSVVLWVFDLLYRQYPWEKLELVVTAVAGLAASFGDESWAFVAAFVAKTLVF